jgi:hypothetical protein
MRLRKEPIRSQALALFCPRGSGSALRQTPAKGTFWISLPSTLWLNELHTGAEGQHASPGKRRHWVEWAMCRGGRNVALDEMMHIDRMSRNID